MDCRLCESPGSGLDLAIMQDAINNLLEWADYEDLSEGQLNGFWPIIDACKNALDISKGE